MDGSLRLNVSDLMEYTEWERQKWLERFRRHGAEVLKIDPGPNRDGRFQNVGELVRHIFSAEKRYIDRLSDRPLTDPASIPADDIEELFRFGQRSRQDLKDFVKNSPANRWDLTQDHKLMDSILTITPRKIVVHILLHEIRHWAQIATLLRMNGFTGEMHDFLFSPVLGGEIRRGQAKP
jgi:uncharacterized damage-inducible protein DinB